MKADDIKDGESLRAWLEQYPVARAQVIATRSAMRVTPFLCSLVEVAWAKHANWTFLLALRPLLVSSVARQFSNLDLASAVFFAGSDGAK